ncbi:LemA family protein [Candidatus Dojkabacteria bacterium]|nr:LemA family protein [Candidatus Dojkabacteria bacterium]
MDTENKTSKTGIGILKIIGLFFAAVIGIVVLIALILIGQYNSLVRLEQEVNNQQAQVETVLQRRYDLIPNLVESAKGVMDQEQEIFTQIAEARTRYGDAQSGSQEKIEAANNLESSLGRLLVIIENYPELKSNETVQSLMDELAGTENRISVERQRYNDSVTKYNIKIKSFPTNLIAGALGFQEKPLFEAVEGAEVAPEVNFD